MPWIIPESSLNLTFWEKQRQRERDKEVTERDEWGR
jgi:hypothetical protein